MTRATPFAECVRTAFEPTPRGVVGLVDDLLNLARGREFCICFQGDRCTIHPDGADSGAPFDVQLPKSAFRALLARFAALCNEHRPNSATPYRGEGEIPVPTPRRENGDPAATCFVRFTNTPSEQRLELRSSRRPAADEARLAASR